MTEEQYKNKIKKIKEANQSKARKIKLRAEKSKYSPFHMFWTKTNTSNKVLISAIIAIILFTAISLWFSFKGITISDTLTTLWYSFWTVEIVSLAGIKISKVFKNDNDDFYIDEANNIKNDFE